MLGFRASFEDAIAVETQFADMEDVDDNICVKRFSLNILFIIFLTLFNTRRMLVHMVRVKLN